MEESAVFKIRAFDEDIYVDVTKAEESFTSQSTTCVYLEENGMETEEAIPRGCYYEGTVQGAENSMVSLSTCAGIVSGSRLNLLHSSNICRCLFICVYVYLFVCLLFIYKLHYS